MGNRLKNILILILCLLFVPWYKVISHRNKRSQIKKILIAQRAKLGDMVCTTPMFRAVKMQYPDAKLTVIGNKTNKELLVGNTDIDNYIVHNKDQSFFSFVKEINKSNFDYACSTSPDFRMLATFFLAKIPLIVFPMVRNGFSPMETLPYKILRPFVTLKDHAIGSYAPREYLKLLEPINVFSSDTTKHLALSHQSIINIDELFLRHDLKNNDLLVGMSVSSGNTIKNWQIKKFVEVIKYLIYKKSAKVIIVGGDNDAPRSSSVKNLLPKDCKIIDTTGRLSVEDLKVLISRLKLFIAVDTGPIYIAEALNVPTIDIVGPMDENEQPPRGKMNINIIPPGRTAPVLHIMNARIYNSTEAIKQLSSITSKMVIEAVNKLLV